MHYMVHSKDFRDVKVKSYRDNMREAMGIKRLQAPNHEKGYEEEEVPQWVRLMYSNAYFGGCIAHAESRKNDLDRFCINCLQSFCHHCLPDHALHKYVKIRKYVYCEVINRQDLSKLFNCSGIQAYHTNKTKVLFLKQRTPQQPQQPSEQQNTQSDCQAKKHKTTRFDHNCIVCDRSLQEATLYCSIECKVSAIHQCEHKGKALLVDNDSSNEKDGAGEREGVQIDEEYVTYVSSKRQKHRKVVALRAPMF